MMMNKSIDLTPGVIPLIAALPFEFTIDGEESDGRGSYDPISQRTLYAGKGYCTCREDESAGGWLKSKSDTKKDD